MIVIYRVNAQGEQEISSFLERYHINYLAFTKRDVKLFAVELEIHLYKEEAPDLVIPASLSRDGEPHTFVLTNTGYDVIYPKD